MCSSSLSAMQQAAGDHIHSSRASHSQFSCQCAKTTRIVKRKREGKKTQVWNSERMEGVAKKVRKMLNSATGSFG